MTRICMLSYNIFIRPPGVATDGNDYKNQRLEEFISKHISKYDIICLQEMFGSFSNRRDWVISEARKLGFLYNAYSTRSLLNICNFFPVDGGLLTLSRYPITSTHQTTFQRGRSSDAFAAKGILYTEICIDGGMKKVEVYNLHMQSLEEYEEVRMEQLEEFREFFVRTHMDSNIAFVAGDFNVNGKNENSYGRLAQKMCFSSHTTLDNFRISLHPSDYARQYTYEHPRPNNYLIDDAEDDTNEILDYIWTILPNSFCNIGEYEVKSVECECFRSSTGKPFAQLSDHCGIELTVNINNRLF